MYFRTIFFYAIAIYISFTSCNVQQNENLVVLQIGTLKVTKPEYEREKGKKKVTDSNLDEWKNEYININLIIADGIQKGFDTVVNVRKPLLNMANYMMVKKNGELWNKTILPKIEKPKVTPKDIEKREQEYYFEFVSIPKDYDTSIITNKDSAPSNISEFQLLKKKLLKSDSNSSGNCKMKWPFLAYDQVKDELYNMKPGEVSKILSVNNFFMYFFLSKVNKSLVNNKEEKQLAKELEIVMEKKVVRESQQEMLASCRPELNMEHIDVIVQLLNKGKSICDFDIDLELGLYYCEGVQQKIKFHQFQDYYSDLIMKRDIKDKQSLLAYLEEFYSDEYLVAKAKKLGLYDTPEFVAASNVYKYSLIRNYYVKNEIENKLVVDSLVVREYYQSHKSQFTQNKYAFVDLYLFNTMEEAIGNMHSITECINSKSELSLPKAVCNIKRNEKVDLENTNRSSRFYTNAIKNMENGSISTRPIRYGMKFVIANRKEETGLYTKELSDVYSQIESKLLKQMVEKDKQKLIKDLAAIYPVEINKLY